MSAPIPGHLKEAGFDLVSSFNTRVDARDEGWYALGSPIFTTDGITTSAGCLGRQNLMSFAGAFFAAVEFTPTNPAASGVTEYILDTEDPRTRLVKVGADNSLRLYIGGTATSFLGTSVYGPYWNAGQKNKIVVSGVSGNVSMWLNEVKILNSVATAYSGGFPSSVYVGGSRTPGDYLQGKVHRTILGRRLLTTSDVAVIFGPLARIQPDRSLITLPGLQQYQRTSDGLWVTEALGKAGIREVLLGSNGLTTSQFPSLVTPRGFSFDGGDSINMGAALSRYDGSAYGAPFSAMCLLVNRNPSGSRNLFIQGPVIGTNTEWLLFYSVVDGKLYGRLYDSGGNHIGRSAPLPRGTSIDGDIPRIFTMTSNGTSPATDGLKLYIGADRADDTLVTAGSYGGSFSGGGDLILGGPVTGLLGFIGDIICPMIFDFELSPIEVAALTHRLQYLYGVTP